MDLAYTVMAMFLDVINVLVNVLYVLPSPFIILLALSVIFGLVRILTV